MDKRADELLSYLVYDLMTYKDISMIMTNGSSRESERARVLSKRFPILNVTYSDKLNTLRHRIIYELLKNQGIPFIKMGYGDINSRRLYNQNIAKMAVLSNGYYDIVVENIDVMEENKSRKMQNVFIYFKNEKGERIPLPLVNHRLSN